MSVFNSLPPKINQYHLIKWLRANYPFLNKKNLSLNVLNSERDKNYLIKVNKKSLYVLKISNPLESKNFLEMQDFLLTNLNSRASIKDFIPKKIHSTLNIYKDEIGRSCYVRILSYIEGQIYAKSKSSKELELSLGSLLGNLSKELQNLGHASSFRKFEWDPSSIDWIKKDTNLFKGKRKTIIKNNFQEYKYFVKKNKNNLLFSLTHGDANNYNLVVKNNKVIGLLDFGDMIFAPTINDLAITLSYALMNKSDLYSPLKNIILSYHNIFSITFDEFFSLMSLVKSRLTITVIMAAKQRKKFPNNTYLGISEKDAWSLLYKLDKINPYLFIYFLRDLCDYPITNNYSKVIDYLKNNKFSNILDFDLNKINKSTIYLNSESIFAKNSTHNPKSISKKINSYLSKNNSSIGIGLYREKRNFYKGKNYVSLLNPNTRRDIHIGIDIFASAGTFIHSPLNGKILILTDNAFEFDYGPTIVLEHAIDKKNRFYTIYGHLSKKCLKLLHVGQQIRKGQVLAEIGNYPINGNWPPHLHFQIIMNMMGEKENFPGVSEDILIPMWSKISPDPNLILGIPNSFFKKHEHIANLITKRRSLVSNNLSISYNKPLQFLEAKGQYLYDDKGRQYLDCVNNISHVGHCHPKIHEALVNQNEKLNTNTRYIYKIMNDYSEKLLSKFPKKLDTVFFVCTGSEANDLAYRIAQTYTHSRDVLVIDNAYHGHTNTLIDLSPYKFKGKGGKGQKDHVHVTKMPDGIRGDWKYKNKFWIKEYIKDVQKIIDQIYSNNKKLSCFFVESILGCGGQIILPPNYLKETFKLVRKKSALCIIDEVQTGFGRVGNNFWGFEEHGVVPDIITLGKPMGNGHPIAAVVTTKEIANVFNNGMEYFNSFGGNPVSCAVGNAVLEVIENEQLQKRALDVGKYFLNSLNLIKKNHPKLISEVRGRGLFIGIDFVNNSINEPNKKLASLIINKLRNQGILLSTDGPYHNVIKIKPPLPFTKEDSDFVSQELDQLLRSLY